MVFSYGAVYETEITDGNEFTASVRINAFWNVTSPVPWIVQMLLSVPDGVVVYPPPPTHV
jgi:hypothetical protein